MNRRVLVTFTLGVALTVTPVASAEQLGRLGGALKKANQLRDIQMTDAEEAQLGAEVSQRIRARYGVVQNLSLIHISEPTRPY